MSLEKLGLTLLLKSMGRYDDIKSHLAISLREFMLALSSTLEVINQTAQEIQIADKAPLVDMILKKADLIVRYSLENLPRAINEHGELDLSALKQEVLESVITIIEEERDTLRQTRGKGAQVQIDALDAIQHAFLRRLKNEVANAPIEDELDPRPVLVRKAMG